MCRKPRTSDNLIEFIEGPSGTTQQILPGVTAIKAGGHFPGSLVLHWGNKLFIADTIVTVPVSIKTNPPSSSDNKKLTAQKSAYTPHPRPPGQTTFVFQWSIPNSIPLPPSEITKMWKAIRPFDFDTTHGAFSGMDIRDKDLKNRLLESMKIQIRNEGYEKHELLAEEL